MNESRKLKPVDDWFGTRILPGKSYDVSIPVSESFSGMLIRIPLHIQRAIEDGPVVFVTAALHGDEINGTGAIHQILQDDDFQLLKGTIILVPVLNILAFERHTRYLPDRRDLNRSFPGSVDGSLASRMARLIFDEIVSRCNFGIDLHTASIRRTNFPNVRGDLSQPEVLKLAESFGSEIIINGKGPQGGLRRVACESGCPTIIMEGGEIWKVEPTIVESATRGIKNVLRNLGMLGGVVESPDYQVIIQKSRWMRADRGGFMQFHVKPGEIIEKDQAIATVTTLLGNERSVVYSPFDAVIIGMTTLPAISPGEPVCNLGQLPEKLETFELRKLRKEEDGLEKRAKADLASNILVTELSDKL